jgi:hypothetical protein
LARLYLLHSGCLGSLTSILDELDDGRDALGRRDFFAAALSSFGAETSFERRLVSTERS